MVKSKKPSSLRADANKGLKYYVRSKGSTDAEYERAMYALEFTHEAREKRKKVTLPQVWVKKGG
jgi:hypothetical protein